MGSTTLTQSNLRKSLSAAIGGHYLIEDDLLLDDDITFPKGSVIEFRGGSINASKGLSNVKLNLNGSEVVSAAQCIFNPDVEVSGFSNDLVKAAWFAVETRSDNANINAAIAAANGCPVILEYKTYKLEGPIKFPNIGNNRQTLISPGILQLAASSAAIDIDVSNVKLEINKIYAPSNLEINDSCVGILLSKSCGNIDVNVFEITGVYKGISINPVQSASIQYCKFEFQSIWAEYCLYVDIFENGGSSSQSIWLSEISFLGGRLRGTNGVYFNNTQPRLQTAYGADCLTFFNIGFEELTGEPLRISNVRSSEFLDLRMAESLPGITPPDTTVPWIILKNSSQIEISVKGSFGINRFKAEDNVDGVVAHSYFLDNYNSYSRSFDTLVFCQIPGANGSNVTQMVATSSIVPYNMCVTLSTDVKTTYSLEDILPEIDNENNGSIAKYYVLPRTVKLIANGQDLSLDLDALRSFAPCIFNIDVTISLESKVTLKNLPGVGTKELKESGLYQLMWDSDWNIVFPVKP